MKVLEILAIEDSEIDLIHGKMKSELGLLEEEGLRGKNLKNMDDEVFYKLKNNKTKHIDTIKNNIAGVLEKYY